MGLKAFFEFKWKYLITRLLSKLLKSKNTSNEYLYVTHDGTKGWILDAKAKRLSANSGLSSKVCYSHTFRHLPDAEGYYFLHQKYFARAIRYNPHLLNRKTIVMFTHPEWNKWYSAQHMAYVLNFANEIICLNTAVASELISLGIPESKIHLFHMASDPELFTPKIRTGNGAIGFSMAFGPRKNPSMVVQLIKEMPHRNFILVGPRWDDYPPFLEIKNSPNLTYYSDLDYNLYPDLYKQMDVYVSTSVLEGGPVPILEVMLSNVVPVASRTGFCPDIIRNGENGFLFNIDANVEDIKILIEKAFELKSDVREGIEKHSWKIYGKKIGELFNGISNL